MPLIRGLMAEVHASDAAAPADNAASLLALLGDSSPSVRRDAARALGAHPAAADALVAQLAAESDPAVRDTLLLALRRIDSPSAARALANLLHSEDVALRNAVLQALPAMERGLLAAVPDLLTDTDRDVRCLTVQMLAASGHPKAVAWALEVLHTDPDVNVCVAATDVLAHSEVPAERDALVALSARFPDEPFVAFTVARALEPRRGS